MNTLLIEPLDRRLVLSGIWIVVMLNMLKADILGLHLPGAIAAVASVAQSANVAATTLMFGAAIMMEISIVMVVASVILTRRANRLANIAVAILTIVFIWGGGSSHPHYLFIATIETICLMSIIGIAWKWPVHQA